MLKFNLRSNDSSYSSKNHLNKLLVMSNLFLVLVILGFIGYSGGWHIPEEILSGTFRANYNFSQNVSFMGDVKLKNGGWENITFPIQKFDIHNCNFRIYSSSNNQYLYNVGSVRENEVEIQFFNEYWVYLYEIYPDGKVLFSAKNHDSNNVWNRVGDVEIGGVMYYGVTFDKLNVSENVGNTLFIQQRCF